MIDLAGMTDHPTDAPAGSIWAIPEQNLIDPPVPITSFLFKVASRCNLDCDYCYVYHGADTSWRKKPKFMSREVIDLALMRIFQHAQKHALANVNIILHGGEPLLLGYESIEYIFKNAIQRSENICSVGLGIQTNGVLLKQEIIELCENYGSTIGISIDGNEKANKHRVYKNGNSSYKDVDKAIELLNSTDEGKRVFGGLLTVINLDVDPIETYKSLESFNPKSVDFLLPDSTHDKFPYKKTSFTDTPYADWLIILFDFWFSQPNYKIRVRFFENIIALLFGGESSIESLGLSPINYLVIETDGTIEGADTLKIAFENAPALQKSIFETSIDDIIYHPSILSRMQGAKSLCKECSGCALVSICGGGHLPHRYSKAKGFNSPSVYCHDIAKLILHIRSVLKNSNSNAIRDTQ